MYGGENLRLNLVAPTGNATGALAHAHLSRQSPRLSHLLIQFRHGQGPSNRKSLATPVVLIATVASFPVTVGGLSPRVLFKKRF
jgi:hypothetical protein